MKVTYDMADKEDKLFELQHRIVNEDNEAMEEALCIVGSLILQFKREEIDAKDSDVKKYCVTVWDFLMWLAKGFQDKHVKIVRTKQNAQ